jgi:anti-sigma factor RsiW
MTDREAGRDERVGRLLMGGLDGELSPDEREELERLLRDDPAVRDEWERLLRLREVTATMTLQRPPDEVWDRYWTGVYRRIERGVGWVLVSIGAVVLVSFGLWEAVRGLLRDTGLPVVVKGAVLALLVGTVVLAVSVAREKLVLGRSDPCKDVRR